MRISMHSPHDRALRLAYTPLASGPRNLALYTTICFHTMLHLSTPCDTLFAEDAWRLLCVCVCVCACGCGGKCGGHKAERG